VKEEGVWSLEGVKKNLGHEKRHLVLEALCKRRNSS